MEANKLIKALIDMELNEVHVALPARINRVDLVKMVAEVTLLPKKEIDGEEEEIKPIVEVPISFLKAGDFIIRPPYKKGDIVQVLFNERALDNLLSRGEPSSIGFSRKFSLDDAVIVGGIRTDNQANLPSSDQDGLYIGSPNRGNTIIMKSNGDICVNVSSGIIQLNGSTHKAIFGDSLVTSFNSHTHSNGNNGSPTGGPITPLVEETILSQKVKLG